MDEEIDPSVFQAPFIESAAIAMLDSWQHDRLRDAETSLTQTISDYTHQKRHAFANRALIRSRLGLWDLAIKDAEEVRPDSLTQPFVLTKHDTVYRDSTICHWLHRKECGAR